MTTCYTTLAKRKHFSQTTVNQHLDTFFKRSAVNSSGQVALHCIVSLYRHWILSLCTDPEDSYAWVASSHLKRYKSVLRMPHLRSGCGWYYAALAIEDGPIAPIVGPSMSKLVHKYLLCTGFTHGNIINVVVDKIGAFKLSHLQDSGADNNSWARVSIVFALRSKFSGAPCKILIMSTCRMQ